MFVAVSYGVWQLDSHYTCIKANTYSLHFDKEIKFKELYKQSTGGGMPKKRQTKNFGKWVPLQSRRDGILL
jgi:hypothetical protein